VKVTGTWGTDATPPDVAKAIVLTAAVGWKRQTFNPNEETPYRGGGDAIPAEARRLMDARR
jgi:hypothetical protein